jgi:hypothetical protein
MASARGSTSWHNQPNPLLLIGPNKRRGYRLSVANVIDVLETPRYFQLLKLPQPESNQAVVDRLVSAGLVIADAGTYAVTNLARITLARDVDAIRPLRRKAPRLILYDGTRKFSTIRDETMGGGYAAKFDGSSSSSNCRRPPER